MTSRVGKGAIVDANCAQIGQVDAVLEKSFPLSFPVSSEQNRPYLADNVALAFEIQSNLYMQFETAMEKTAEIERLRRASETLGNGGFVMHDWLFNPTFIIGFRGHSTLYSIYKASIPSIRAADSVNAVLSIESGTFVGRRLARFEDGGCII
jgi:hypothetical protein